MMGFDTLLIGGFVTYMVIKYAENTWKAEPMDMETIEEVFEQHREGRSMIREKNREINRVRRDLRVARKLKEMDDEIEESQEELEELGYHKQEEETQKAPRATRKRTTPVPVRPLETNGGEEEEDSIHIYSNSKPLSQASHMRRKATR